MAVRSVLVTGASGFVGRHLLDAIKDDYKIFGLARRSQLRSGAPVHPNIQWFQVDIGEREALERAFLQIRAVGGADTVVHLAAHYDFTGEDEPEYWRTNVEGLRNVLDLSRAIGVKRFVFSSSVAASRFPPLGASVDETSPPDGREVYSVTKGVGEKMLAEYDDAFRSVIVRFGALFSDWCEYAPLFSMIKTWLSDAWNARILAGRGRTALPYMHVREIPPFVQRVLDRIDAFEPREVLIASTDGAVSHNELYHAVLSHYHGRRREPIHLPKAACGPGMFVRDWTGRLTGNRPFERPWMRRYIDTVLAVNASKTRSRLGWAPRGRLEIIRRMPFLMENLKMDPVEWHRKNSWAMRLRVRPNLRIHAMLERREKEIGERLTAYMFGSEGSERFPHYMRIAHDRHQWHHALTLRQLMNAIRTRERGVFFAYCDDLAEHRFEQGFPVHEVCDVLEMLGRIAVEVVQEEPEASELHEEIHDYVTMALRFGVDRVLERYDVLAEQRRRGAPPGIAG